MAKQTTLDIVRNLASELTGVPVEELTGESKLTEDLGMDSLDWVEFVMDIEDELGVEIDDEQAGAMITLQDAANVADAAPKFS